MKKLLLTGIAALFLVTGAVITNAESLASIHSISREARGTSKSAVLVCLVWTRVQSK